MATVAIVGAGLIGRLIACLLAQQGIKVTLFDKDSREGKLSAAFAAAGLLTPLGESLTCDANMVAMGRRSLKLWPKLISQLSLEVPFQHQGSLIVNHHQDFAEFQRFYRHIKRNYPSYLVKSLEQNQLEMLEPALAIKFSQGLLIEDEGLIDNRALLIALKQRLIELKVNWQFNTNVLSIKPSQVETKQQSQTFDLVIDSRGLGANMSASKCEGELKNEPDSTQYQFSDLRGVRGELLHVYAPEVSISRPVRLMHPRYKLYLAPRDQHHYVLGATEIESDDTKPITVQSSLELLSALYSLHPGFAEAQVIEQVSQCRPAFSDNKPRIISHSGLIQVNGLYRHGYLISPFVLKSLMPEITQQLSAETFNNEFCSSLSSEEQQLADTLRSYPKLNGVNLKPTFAINQ